MSGVHSTPDRRSLMRMLQALFPDFFYEDEERSVWATPVGAVVWRAVQIASDPDGPFRRVYPSPLAVGAWDKSQGAGWVTSTVARAIQRSSSSFAIIACTDSMDHEKAAYHLASEAINTICRDWTRTTSDKAKRP